MRYMRKVYNMNPKAGKYPTITFPPELAGVVGSGYVFLEPVPGGIMIRSAKIEPA